MISLIVEAMQAARAAFDGKGMAGYAHHTGKAGGVAAAAGVYGIKALSLCDDISDAYEGGDAGFMAAILAEAAERLDNPNAGAAITDAGKAISWAEYGAALHQAAEAKDAGDGLRFALMTGFAAGLMFNSPGPKHPEYGTVPEAVAAAYETGSDELLRYALARIGAGARMTDPTPFMGDEQYNRHREERMRMMRWLQNFGLRQARASDQRVAVPGAMRINHAARQLAQQSSEAKTCIDLGSAKKRRRDYEGAIAEYDRAIALTPDNADAYYLRGDAKRVTGDYEGAIADCDRAIALDPGNAGGCNIRGMARWESGDSAGALVDFDCAIELDPEHAAAYYIRGMIKEETGDSEEAVSDFDRAIELGHDGAEVYNYRAMAKNHSYDYDGAIADLDRAIELDPNEVWTHRYRGFINMNLERYKDAIVDFERVLELEPGDGYAIEHLSIARGEVE